MKAARPAETVCAAVVSWVVMAGRDKKNHDRHFNQWLANRHPDTTSTLSIRPEPLSRHEWHAFAQTGTAGPAPSGHAIRTQLPTEPASQLGRRRGPPASRWLGESARSRQRAVEAAGQTGATGGWRSGSAEGPGHGFRSAHACVVPRRPTT